MISSTVLNNKKFLTFWNWLKQMNHMVSSGKQMTSAIDWILWKQVF